MNVKFPVASPKTSDLESALKTKIQSYLRSHLSRVSMLYSEEEKKGTILIGLQNAGEFIIQPIQDIQSKEIITLDKEENQNSDLDSGLEEELERRRKVWGEKMRIAKRMQDSQQPKVPSVIPTLDFGADGWISPEGEYYYCNTQGHIALAEALYMAGKTHSQLRIGWNGNMEGWIHLSNYEFKFRAFENPLTQKQIDFLFKYAEKLKLYKLNLFGTQVELSNLQKYIREQC